MAERIYGYARVSTQDQELARQIDALEKYGVNKIFTEKMTGTKAHRPELDKLKERLDNGDTVIIESLSRLGRSTNVLKDLREALVNIQIAFERKQAILKAKGKTAVVGLILTYIPFVIPSFFNNFDPKLFSGIIGATSIISNRNLLNEFVELTISPKWG